MTLIHSYFDVCIDQLQQILHQSGAAIEEAAQAVGNALIHDRHFYLFGSGHSALIAREAFWRAGGLAPAMPLPDPLAGDLERLSGLAAAILGHYRLDPGDVIIVISNSGINCLPVEIALESKARGLVVIAVTSLAHSLSVSPRHLSGRRLLEIADVVVDTHGLLGDAAVPLLGSELKVGATSTVIGAAIIESIMGRAAEIMAEHGVDPPVIVSANTPEGDAHNRKLAERYRQVLVRYEIPTVDVANPWPDAIDE
jgi:uncharacterized phosphosugar-binding protein